jgi:hypothetical protein
MFLKYRLMDEQEEAGEGGGGVERDIAAEVTAILDAQDAEESGDKAATVTEADPDDGDVTVAGAVEADELHTTSTEDENFLTDDLRSLGATYGFNEESMLSQGSEAALRNAMLLVDQYEKRQLDRARGSQRPPEPQAQDWQIPQNEAPPEVQAEMVQKPHESNADFVERMKVLQDDGYDTPLTGMFDFQQKQIDRLMAQIDQQQSALSMLDQHAQRVQQGAVHNYQTRVLDLVDSLGRDDLFGTVKTATEEHHENVRRVENEIRDLMEREGLELDPTTVQRAYHRVFAEQLIRESRNGKVKAVQDQSRRRMGSGSTAKARKDLAWDGPADEDPVLLAMGNRFMQENRGI